MGIAEALEPSLVLAAAAAVVAGLIRGFTGFGSALTMAPVFSLVFTPAVAVGLVMALELVASFQLLPGVFRHTAWREVLPMGLTAWLTVPLGTWLLVTLDPELMRRGISAFVLVFAVVLLSGWRWHGARGLPLALTVSAVSGALNGATSTGGPPVILYMLSGPSTSARARANLISYFTLINIGTVASLAVSGVYTPATLWRALLLLPAFLLPLEIGARLFRRSGDASYRRLALLFLMGVALFGLFYR